MQNKYQNLQKSVYFKSMPKAAQEKILAQPDLGAACREAQIQYEENFEVTYAGAKEKLAAGEGIDALAEIGHPGEYDNISSFPQELQNKLAELDPFQYHPDSIKLTPRAKEKVTTFFNKLLNESV